jgi:hypothetical protein
MCQVPHNPTASLRHHNVWNLPIVNEPVIIKQIIDLCFNTPLPNPACLC